MSTIVQQLALHFEHHFYKVPVYTQSIIARNDSTSNVGLKGKLVVKPAITHPSNKLKIAFSNTFNRDCKKLKSFLIQVELQIAFNAKHFRIEVKQVLQAVALLRGPALDQISSYLSNYITHCIVDGRVTTSANQSTKDIFISQAGFVKQLRINFRDVNT